MNNTLFLLILMTLSFASVGQSKPLQWEKTCETALIKQAKLTGPAVWYMALPKFKARYDNQTGSKKVLGSYVEFHGAYRAKSGVKVLRGYCSFVKSQAKTGHPGSKLVAARILQLISTKSPYSVSTAKLPARLLHTDMAKDIDSLLGDTVNEGPLWAETATDGRGQHLVDCQIRPKNKSSRNEFFFFCNVRFKVTYDPDAFGEGVEPTMNECRLVYTLTRNPRQKIAKISLYRESSGEELVAECLESLNEGPY